jgi:hypothetical protein
MSPNVWINFDDDNNLVATDGERQYKKWTYSDFERHYDESITPAMYEYMLNYVYENMTKSRLYDIEGDSYEGDVDAEAVEAYIELPALERQAMHDQMVANLEKKIKETHAKWKAANSTPEFPFDPSSPLYAEVQEFWAKLGYELGAKLERLEAELIEEEQWRGGWEDGESQTDGPRYDEGDEV